MRLSLSAPVVFIFGSCSSSRSPPPPFTGSQTGEQMDTKAHTSSRGRLIGDASRHFIAACTEPNEVVVAAAAAAAIGESSSPSSRLSSYSCRMLFEHCREQYVPFPPSLVQFSVPGSSDGVTYVIVTACNHLTPSLTSFFPLAVFVADSLTGWLASSGSPRFAFFAAAVL